ncbi:MAG TPA: YbhN family protein, partial [Solirubrobacteraceae bacterium]|nr:YbhN family protein [Solirubrobacteraceae bacterium]
GTVPVFGTLVLGYLIGQLGNLIPLPGGVGGTEGALIGVFALYGVNLTEATAAVLLYRLFQLIIPAVLGAPAFVLLRRKLMHTEQPAVLCEPLALNVVELPSRT